MAGGQAGGRAVGREVGRAVGQAPPPPQKNDVWGVQIWTLSLTFEYVKFRIYFDVSWNTLGLFPHSGSFLHVTHIDTTKMTMGDVRSFHSLLNKHDSVLVFTNQAHVF